MFSRLSLTVLSMFLVFMLLFSDGCSGGLAPANIDSTSMACSHGKATRIGVVIPSSAFLASYFVDLSLYPRKPNVAPSKADKTFLAKY